jgi:hypothetical protein
MVGQLMKVGMKAHKLVYTSLITLSAWASPSQVQHVDFRSNIILQTIELHRESPAYAALEDVRENFSATSIEPQITGELVLTGKPLEMKLKEQQAIVQQGAVLGENLKPLIISAANGTSATSGASSDSSPNQSKRDHLAELIRDYQMSRPQTVAELAEALVGEELRERNFTQARKIQAKSGQEIIVAKPVQIITQATAGKGSGPVAGAGSTEAYRTINLKQMPALAVAATPAVAQVENQKSSPRNDNPRNNRASIAGPYRIRGPITLSGGAALIDSNDQVFINQIRLSQGFVNIDDARYDISVSDLEGELQLLVISRDGQLRALGQKSIVDLATRYKNQARIEGIELKVQPIENSLSGTVISAASYGKTVFNLADAKVRIEDIERVIFRNKKTGRFDDQDIMLPSTAILTAKQENFTPSISIADSGIPFQIRLFPNSLVDAFLNLVYDKYVAVTAKSEGLIWGRVSFGGRPVEGAKVGLVGSNEVQPTYFSGFLPDKTRTTTSQRGDFAFTRLTNHEELLRVSLGTKIYWPVMVPTQNGFVYYADLEAQPTRTLDIKSFDAFTLQPVPTIAQPLGTHDEIIVNESGRTQIKADTVRGLTFIEAHSGSSYQPTRTSLRAAQVEVNLSHIKTDWLKAMREKAQLKPQEYASAVIGFIDGEDYDVILGESLNLTSKNVVYFNQAGESKTSNGEVGGGFIIFDLPRGLNTVTIVPKNSKKVITQIVYADEFAAHILRLNLSSI